ncbi:MAG: hypothetical protein FH749_07580 [Firmicutes bacterium]|nr:hypothetical protein [Bacillota bacterium]
MKPLLEVTDGKISTAGRSRSRKRSLSQLLETVVAGCPDWDGHGFVAAVGQGGAREEQAQFAEALKARLPRAEVMLYDIGIAIATHGGPGTLGVCYFCNA